MVSDITLADHTFKICGASNYTNLFEMPNYYDNNILYETQTQPSSLVQNS